ncbi:hypothetical protein DAI22_06g164500 [Oryza sativa Japonica Group]|nr:hypothetical protein DAI22_06g164500 [Oryza sativa Japonica Group]
MAAQLLDLNLEPPIDWDAIGDWVGPAHELEYDMVFIIAKHLVCKNLKIVVFVWIATGHINSNDVHGDLGIRNFRVAGKGVLHDMNLIGIIENRLACSHGGIELALGDSNCGTIELHLGHSHGGIELALDHINCNNINCNNMELHHSQR